MGANQAPSGTELLSKEEQARKEMERVKANVTLESDAEYQKYVQKTFPPLVSETHFLSPLKRKVYLANVSKNGFFKNGETVAVGKDKYTLKLTRQEIEALEPGLYLKSYRIKSSTKKVTLVTRLVGGMPLLAAITQCQFGLKKVLRELAELLQRGVDKAPLLKLDPQDLYISQIWSGSDGKADKLMDIKGRGRLGVIRFRYAHVRVVLKTSQTKRRLAWEQQQKQAAKPAWDALASHKLRGVAPGHFGW